MAGTGKQTAFIWAVSLAGGRNKKRSLKLPRQRLYMLRDTLKTACTDETCGRIAREIYQLQAENLWLPGLAAEVPQPFIHKKALGNLACAQARGYFLSTVLSGAR